MSIIPGGTEHFKNVCMKEPLLSLHLASSGKGYFKLYLQLEILHANFNSRYSTFKK